MMKGLQQSGADEFLISKSAAKRIAHLVGVESNPALMFRVSVSGGGCAGFQYGFDLDDRAAEDDLIFEKEGAKVVVDQTSLDLLRGSELDFVEELVGSYFSVKNPNAASSCGCGTSFSVDSMF